jgi:hypothetical protein
MEQRSVDNNVKEEFVVVLIDGTCREEEVWR